MPRPYERRRLAADLEMRGRTLGFARAVPRPVRRGGISFVLPRPPYNEGPCPTNGRAIYRRRPASLGDDVFNLQCLRYITMTTRHLSRHLAMWSRPLFFVLKGWVPGYKLMTSTYSLFKFLSNYGSYSSRYFWRKSFGNMAVVEGLIFLHDNENWLSSDQKLK